MDLVQLTAWLEEIVRGLVAYPDDVKIIQTSDDMGILFSVKVHDSDIGKVIGKEGSIANAIRVVLRSAGRLINVRASMKVDVPNSNFQPREDFGKDFKKELNNS